MVWAGSDRKLLVASVPFTKDPRVEADARLISAAPELLASLIWAQDVLLFKGVIEDARDGSPGSLASKMRAAIAKAMGESS